MQEIRNIDKKLVAVFDPMLHAIEIVIKGCKTTIFITKDRQVRVTNQKTA